MPIYFNTILEQEKVPIDEVRLLRHQDRRAGKGRSPYQLWRDSRDEFERYQSHQSFENRSRLNRKFWASFVGTPDGQTIFVGLYSVQYRGLLASDTVRPHTGEIERAGSCDVYDLTREKLIDLDGRLIIAWGEGTRSWIQRADNQNKPVIELRQTIAEPEFPGFSAFVSPLSRIGTVPHGWQVALRASKGIYLLTCPKTKEQYVGSASGQGGFFDRWMQYVQSGHGGNEGLKSRDPSDYQVSILEVVGSTLSVEEILMLEKRWKQKLQSREMGLNRN